MTPYLRPQPVRDLIKLLALLSPRRKVQAVMLGILTVASAASEVAVLGLVVPFLSLVVAPAQALESPLVRQIASLVGVVRPEQLLLPVTVVFCSVAVVAGAVRTLLLYATLRFTNGLASELSSDAYRRALYQSYEVHVSRNTAEVISTIKAKLDGVIGGILQPALTMFSSSILLIAIVATLIVIDPVVASLAMGTFGGIYVVATLWTKRSIRRLGRVMSDNQSLTLKALQEGLNGIRDVLLSGAQERYTSDYRSADYPQRRAAGSITFLSQGVRYLVEVVAMLLIAILAYSLAQQPGGAAASIPTLGALALGGQRLLPMLQQFFSSWSIIQGHSVYLKDVLAALSLPVPAHGRVTVGEPLQFNKAIVLTDVTYTYAQGLPPALKGVSLTIPRGSRVGIVGPTGGGKSTLADIIMGLLRPQVGRVEIDGVQLDEANLPMWHRNVAHVPQSIYLVDGSFAENIAIGDAAAPLDMSRVTRAAQAAQIADFVVGRNGGYDASTGEDGAWLSGGQRQRVGIARALYKDAKLLVLDEATSALDTGTEDLVMQSLHEQDASLTVIMIAHRVSTLRNCNFIIRVEGGEVTAKGSFEELIGTGA